MDATHAQAPTILTVFGATGDLMAKKVVPSLWYLSERGRLPQDFVVVGYGRREWDDARFRQHVASILDERTKAAEDPQACEAFLGRMHWAHGQFDDEAAYAQLAERLGAVDESWGTCANKLFYLAVPPEYVRGILEHLAQGGLTKECGGERGWTRVLVEKPFGRDAKTSRELDELLARLFREEQVYRIDHYLAKEMLQGVLAFRFSNNLFEPMWNAQGVERIDIALLEEIGVEDRGAFYDGVGALRDVGQNHLLQMLALVTMDQPASLAADHVRTARARQLADLRPLTPEQVAEDTFRAQYDGFREVEGVSPDSATETYFKLRTRLAGPRWGGVPVYLESGKRMGGVCKEIVVTLRHTTPCLCPDDHHFRNRVTFRIEPDETITISFRTKRPGFERDLEQRAFDFFLYEKQEKAQYVEEYATLLDDAICGDQTLFVSTDEIREMWRFIDPIMSGWAEDVVPLEHHKPGTDDILIRADETLALAEMERAVGVVGLGRMGAGLARNLLEHDWRVVAWNRTHSKAEALASDGAEAVMTFAELAQRLPRPRTVWVMLTAGDATETALFGEGGLADVLDEGDLVIDGGNSYYKDAPRRAAKLAERGIGFLDVGTSGGPAGARHGACLMVGGQRREFEAARALFEDVSVPGGYRFFEGHGAGHFVKMVHNGIEYGMMQAVAEGFAILRRAEWSLDLDDVAEVYNRGSVIESRLVGWLRDAFALHGTVLEGVSGSVGHTGEGEWTVRAARELGVEDRVIEAALQFRLDSERNPSYIGQVLSALREQFGQHEVAPPTSPPANQPSEPTPPVATVR